jgi:hypothetical protein
LRRVRRGSFGERRGRRVAKENQAENMMTNDISEERETICLVSDPAYGGGPTIKWPPDYFIPPSAANKVATTADLNNALMEAAIKELASLGKQFQGYDDILTALTNARRIVARHLRVNLTGPATALSIPVEDLTSENDG